MAGRDKDAEARGWSVVFRPDEATDERAPHTPAERRTTRRPKPREPSEVEAPVENAEGGERTIIDAHVLGEVSKELKALRSGLGSGASNNNDTLADGIESPIASRIDRDRDTHPDPAEVGATAADEDDSVPASSERTMISRGPFAIPNDPTEASSGPPADFGDEATIPPGAMMSSLDAPTATSLPVLEASMLDADQDETPESIEEPLLNAAVTDASPAPGSFRVAKEVDARNKRIGDYGELTQLDIAAQLGLSPEPQRTNLRVENESPEDQHPKKLNPLQSPTALVDEAARVAEMLREEERALPGQPKKFKRSETLMAHLPHWLSLTEGAAKIIPLLIGVFMVVSVLGVALMMAHSRVAPSNTEHVTLRFLQVQEAAQGYAYAPPPLLTIETDPPGLLVVLDRKILGPTPLTFESPMRGDRIGIELSGPYYETWVGEATPDAAGGLKMTAKLTRRRR